MKIVVIGAGASLEQSRRLGSPENLRPPLIGNFAQRLWAETNLALPQSLWEYMQLYLTSLGHDSGSNPLTTFIELERLPETTVHVERFFEFAWLHRNALYDEAWGELIWAVIHPLIDLFPRNGFFENGVGWKPFTAYQALANKLCPGDLVVNLNYEPLFEMGAEQIGRSISYVPNKGSDKDILVAKPHGSINLIVEKNKFWFSEPDIIGSVMHEAEHMSELRGIIAPRYGKSYQQHPIALIIIDAIKSCAPESLTFWGVGFTASDVDLTSLYQRWSQHASSVGLIHPYPMNEIADAEALLGREVTHFSSPEEWSI